MPPASPHANDNLFPFSFNNFLWRLSKSSSARDGPCTHPTSRGDQVTAIPAIPEMAPGARVTLFRKLTESVASYSSVT